MPGLGPSSIESLDVQLLHRRFDAPWQKVSPPASPIESPDHPRFTLMTQPNLMLNRYPFLRWSVWKYHFSPQKPGEYIVRVKATDGNGTTQPENDSQASSGMSGQPRMRLDVISIG
jgi:hypothetical protein